MAPSSPRRASTTPPVTTSADFSAPVSDVLGTPYVTRTVPLSLTDGGHSRRVRDVATVVHRSGVGRHGRAVVYLHGFIDTFFHAEHEAAWHDAGWDLYALEMRRSGRSLRPGQVRDDIRMMHVRHEEVGLAVDLARSEGAEEVVLLGHSTGGLQAVLFAHDHPGAVDAVLLNSPWLDLGRGWPTDVVATALVDRLAPLAPRLPISSLTGTYGDWLTSPDGGGWDVPPSLKPTTSMPVHAGFFRAVRRAQRAVQRGRADVAEPVLLAMSRRSGARVDPGPADLSSSDVVLDVRTMRRSASLLGERVDVLEVPGGIHDLALSPEPARSFYASEVIAWACARPWDR
ncbi:alpha/beta hydrolase [Georgenia sp. Z1344]|uniref:alpha/beta hydrolase n=1 Tax=Georgenia sp. Z1344 TaxID=3416706 RepID=UPI003CED88D3